MTIIYRIYDIAALAKVEAQDCIKGIFVNPKLPAHFDDTSNEDRPFEHMLWWGRPFILGSDGEWTLRCLDGGAWDRSTNLGGFKTLDEAVEEAHRALLHPKFISLRTPLPGHDGAFSMAPVEWE